MIAKDLEIAEVKFLKPTRFSDERGYFSEVFNFYNLEKIGIQFRPAQENQSMSKVTGTVRGLHFQRHPFAQTKLLRVLKGRIFDVAVDIRFGSPTFGRWVGEELTAAGGEQLFIPAGFAHGFCTLEPDTEVAYLVDARYDAASDGAILWNDPALAIQWPPFAGAALSAKDASAPRLADIDAPFTFEK